MPASLEPETVWTGEIALDQRLSDHVDMSASVYSYQVEDLITQVEDASAPDGLYFANEGGASATGVEGELRLHWASGVRVRVSHSWGRAEDQADALLSNSPLQMARAAVVAPHGWGRLVLGANAEYMGERRSTRGAEVGGAALANVTLSRAGLWRGAAVGCSVYNLFDTRYLDPASAEHRQSSLQQDGRTVLARITWAF
jgi:iron complex outermembrane receptor protein